MGRNEKWLLLLLMAVMVPLAGELHFNPFGDDFRVSLGTPVFFFFLLWIRGVPAIASGLIAGVCVMLFRIGLGALTVPDPDWARLLWLHYPALFYYLAYGAAFFAMRLDRRLDQPLLLGVLGLPLELTGTVTELLLRYAGTPRTLTLAALNQIAIIALFRSFFVLGFFNLLKLRESQAAGEQQRRQNEEMLLLVSELYEESLHLQKSLQDAERMTQASYGLYQALKQSPSPGDLEGLAQQALALAGGVHEIKKDSQRIHAGLSRLITEDGLPDYMAVEELAGIVLRSNGRVARLLGKRVRLEQRTAGPLPLCHAYTLLSLLNNAVVNSVEAITEEGTVRISAERSGEHLVLRVADDGPGIPVKMRELVFQPGFTTKYDKAGRPSTGIGLGYVKMTVEALSGSVALLPGIRGRGNEVCMILPLGQIGKEG
ncbi:MULTISPECIES: ATP-binding protein [Paenibacillus]|uniref:ATP-binding protein n=1 Tax=Paenibacillus TaxID=44249 RepID=UPI0022B873A6|nr:sensor histidine kinase [Paenibacillus caseinilyticus]MCZ8522617.1 sensor histidine kinase [Paenibacillus caseinilyticus]